MDFNIEDDLDAAKKRTVEEATEKFGSRATPMAEKVGDKTEDEVAKKLGVPLHNQQNAGGGQPERQNAAKQPASQANQDERKSSSKAS